MNELNKIYNEDCLEGMKRIEDKSIDMILCDLPYGTTACKWDVIIPFEPLWKQYERVIKDNGAIVLTASQPFTSALVISNLKMFKYEWVWNKVQPTGHLNAKKQPLRVCESVVIFYKSQPLYNPQLTSGSIIKRTTSKLKGDKPTEVYGFYKPLASNSSQVRQPTTLLTVSSGKSPSTAAFHPTQKPVALFEYLIKTYTNECETVLDNCMGGGTTAIACINTNRNYIGFEKEEKYFKIIQDRIKNHVPQMKLAV